MNKQAGLQERGAENGLWLLVSCAHRTSIFQLFVMLVALNRYHTALVLVFAVFTCNEALKSIVWNIMGQPSPYLKNYAVFLSLIAYPSFFEYRASNHW